VQAVRAVREADPGYSAKKIRPILLRERASGPSTATLGRLIARENLFFRPDTKRHTKRSKTAQTAHERLRKPSNLKADGARQIIEFDMQHGYLLGEKHSAFCAIDPYRKAAVIPTACSPSSRNATAAPQKAVARFGKSITVVNDNGSENMKDAQDYLTSRHSTQYWTRPKSPKEKPFVERLIGTLQRECLDYHYEPMNVGELTEIVDAWLDKYHFYRPHEALNFLTPAEFSATLGLSSPRSGVS
jgi:putative transposase